MRATFVLAALGVVALFQISSGRLLAGRLRASRTGSDESSSAERPSTRPDDEQPGHGGQEIARALMSDYMSNISPGKTTVQIGVKFICAQLDEDSGALTLHVWQFQMWDDWRLKWSDAEAESTGIRSLNMWSWNVWLPDITQYNSYAKNAEHEWTNVVVMNTGQVMWVPKVTYYIMCAKNSHSAGLFNCTLPLGSWTSDTDQLDLESPTESDEIQGLTSNYLAECPYVVSNVATSIRSTTYACCPDAPYETLETTFDVRRKH